MNAITVWFAGAGLTSGAALLLIKVTLVLAAAAAVATLLGRRSAAARHDVWSAALVAALALVPLVPLAPPIRLALLPVARAAATAAPQGPAIPDTTSETPRPSEEPTTGAVPHVPASDPLLTPLPRPRGATPADRTERLPAPRLATLFWLVGAAFLMLRCVLGNAGLWWLARRARPLDSGDWQTLVAEATATIGLRRSPRLRVSDRVGTPLTWGWLRPVVVLPAVAASWPQSRRRATLLHELAHIARRDYLVQLAGNVACAIYWFHPLAWAALRGLRRESERACDDRVLAGGMPAPEYASQLLEVARGARALRHAGGAMAIGMARPSTLEGRLVAVLADDVPRCGAPLRSRRLAVAAVVVGIVPLAGATPVSRAATIAEAATVRIGSASARATSPPMVTAELVTTRSREAAAPAERAAKVATVSSAGEAADADPARSIHRSLAAADGGELRLDLDTGAGVEILGWDQPRVEIEGELGGRDWRDTGVDIQPVDHGVEVHLRSLRRSGSFSTSHHLRIHVPRRYDLELRSSGGDVSLDGVEGAFRGSTGGGELKLTHLRGSAHLSTGGGEILVTDSTLSGSVSTGGGGVVLSRVSGGLRGSSGSGPVVRGEPDDTGETAGDLGDTADLESGGEAVLEGIDSHGGPAGKVHISRAGGDVRLAGAPKGAVITTGGGEIVVGRSAGLVEVSTGGGDVRIGPVAGSVIAGTGAGRVEVTLADPPGDEPQTAKIDSGSGHVVLVLPRSFRGTVELESAYTEGFGRETRVIEPWGLPHATSEWDSSEGTPRRYVRARGTVGGGGKGWIRVRTVNGDVEVRTAG